MSSSNKLWEEYVVHSAPTTPFSPRVTVFSSKHLPKQAHGFRLTEMHYFASDAQKGGDGIETLAKARESRWHVQLFAHWPTLILPLAGSSDYTAARFGTRVERPYSAAILEP